MLTFSEATVALLGMDAQPSNTPSAAVCVRTSEQAETGVLTRSSTPPFSSDAPFIVYSITKSFLAATALKLVARHVLDLDVPIIRWLPAIPHADSITLRHLLRHASGLPDYGGVPAYHDAVQRGDQPWSDAQFLTRSHADTLLFAPGQGWSYSNIGYMVVRQLLETVQTAQLSAIMDAEIFAPLGMTASYVLTTDAQLAQLTFGPSSYLGTAEQPLPVAEHYHIDWVAHRAIASTVAEIAHFFDALLAEQIIPPALLREMCTATPLPVMTDRPVIRPGYGMGLQVDQGWSSGPIYGHSGGGPGAQLTVYSLRSQPQPITVVVASTGEDIAQAEEIAVAVLKSSLH